MEFFSRYKKLFIITGFIALIFLLGFTIFSLFFKPAFKPVDQAGTGNQQQTATGTPGLPGAKTGGQQVVTEEEKEQLPENQGGQTTGQTGSIPQEAVETTEFIGSPALDTTLSPNGRDLQYYDKNDGKFYRIDNNGDVTSMTDKVFHSVQNITWSSDKNKAILEYPDGANIIYDFENNKQVTLPKHWKDFDFEPNGSSIVMKSMGLDPENRWLAITNDEGTKFKAIEALGDKDATVYPSWSPNKQIVAMFTEGIDFDRQNVFFVGLNKENFKSMVIEGRGFEPKWSPAGDKLLYSVYSSNNNLKPNLWITSAQGEQIGNNRTNLAIETWANKCTFANNRELYCAVPESLEEGAGLMPELANGTKDNLYKIDLETGVKKIIATPQGSFTMSDLIINSSQNYIYFTDKNTNKTYKIKL